MKDTTVTINKEDLMEVLNKALDSGVPVTITIQLGGSPATQAPCTSIYSVLKSLGVREDLTGFTCLIEAVELIIAEPNRATQFCDQVLEYIGTKHNVPGRTIEHRVRHAIESAFAVDTANKLQQELFRSYLSDCQYRPTVKQFIMGVVNYVRENGTL